MDTSAFLRQNRLEIADRLDPLFEAEDAAICGVVTLEAGAGARTAQRHANLLAVCLELPQVNMAVEDFDRAVQVQGHLARRGQQTGPRLGDLLIAACAERLQLTVLHYDADFETVAAVTGQLHEWVVVRGSVP